MTKIKKRAITQAQKQQRSTEILAAALARFDKNQFADIRLVDIANDVGITKAALYRYFRNKELLFLALYQQQLELLVQNTQGLLTEKPFAQALTQAILIQPDYCKLTSILHTILERNISVEEAKLFKFSIAQLMTEMLGVLTPNLSLTKQEVIAKFFMLHQFIIGAWASSNPSDTVKQAIESEPELALFDLSFEKALSEQISLLFSD